MLRRTVTALLLVFAVAGSAAAVAPVIHDEGKFFSPEALKKANEQIREIARKYDRDFLLETFAAPPGNQADKVKELKGDERAKFFQEWAKTRVEGAVVKGVYVLVCKEPPYLFVHITSKSTSVFDDKSRNKLRELLLEEFRSREYDQGLHAAVKFVQERFAAAKSGK